MASKVLLLCVCITALFLVSLSEAFPTAHKVKSVGEVNSTVRATECISNSTHCHCSRHSPGANAQCYKPAASEEGQCYRGSCASGYRCDCNSNTICEKLSTVYYIVSSEPTTQQFDCTKGQKRVPKQVVGYTADFHVIAYQEFQIFVNSEQIGYAESGHYGILTAEISVGDVIGVIAGRSSAEKYGVKLRFNDVRGETRVIDENWFVSSTFQSGWLDSSFDPSGAGWSKPSIVRNVTDPSFDSDIPWMWFGNSDTVYFRYVIP